MFNLLTRWVDRLIDGAFICFYCGCKRGVSRSMWINSRDWGFGVVCARCGMVDSQPPDSAGKRPNWEA